MDPINEMLTPERKGKAIKVFTPTKKKSILKEMDSNKLRKIKVTLKFMI